MSHTLISFILILLATAGGAAGRRLAGGWIAKWLPFRVGTQTGRAVHGVMAAITLAPLAFWTGHPWGAIPLIAIAILLGDMLQGFPLGAPDANGKRGSIMVPTTWQHVAMISLLNGALGLLPMGLALVIAGVPPWWLVIAAALHGPAYWLATLWLPRWRWVGILNKDKILEAPPLAELYVGGLRSLGIALTLAVPWGPTLAPMEFLLGGLKHILP